MDGEWFPHIHLVSNGDRATIVTDDTYAEELNLMTMKESVIHNSVVETIEAVHSVANEGI